MLISLLAKMAVVMIWGIGGSLYQTPMSLAEKINQADDTVSTVVIYPDHIELEQGNTFQFDAVAFNQDGQQIEFSPIWMTTGGEITQEGLYQATTTGSYEVLVTDAHTGAYAVAVVHIACHRAADACLVIYPDRVELSRGETIQFTAYGYDEANTLVPIAVHWESGGGWIDESGNYTADEVGEFLITATQLSSGKYGTAHVSVRYISILPPWMYLQSGKWWFTIVGVLIGLSIGMGYYLYRHDHFKERTEIHQT